MSSPDAVPQFFGRYQVLEELGAGAMGVVYLCVDPRLARPVAIKRMKESEYLSPGEREEYHARFRQEAEAAGRLSHPDIVQIFDIGPQYLVMEFVEGRTLQALLKSEAQVSVQELLRIVQRVAEALAYAHRHGIVHRDIKPANIMLVDDGGVKVMDFGVARLENSNLTAAGTVLGSVRYMAPEQMMGQRVDARADVFSLAAVAYELFTGKAPFPGKTVTEVVSRVVHGGHVPPRQVDRRFPEELDAVFARAFAPDPARRCGHALDLARELGEALRLALRMEVRMGGGSAGQETTRVPAPTAVDETRLQTSTETRAPLVPAPLAPGSPVDPTQVLAQAGASGALALDSLPAGALVLVDGNAVGHTPVALLPLAFGVHRVRFEAPGREPRELEVAVDAERALVSLSVELLPERGRPAGAGPGTAAPVRVSGALPERPAAARALGLVGSAEAEVLVGEDGSVQELRLLRSAGALLDAALLECLAGWRFTPARRDGRAVAARLVVRHSFGG